MASVHSRTRTDKSGKVIKTYFVRWQEGGTQPSKGGFKFQRDAEAYKRKIERILDDGESLRGSTRCTVNDVCREFGERCDDRLDDGRIGKARHSTLDITMRVSIMPYLGKMVFADITVSDIEKFYRWMTKERGLSPRTARERIYILKQIEDFARKRGYAKSTIIADGLRELRGVAKPKVRTFTAEQVQRLLHAAKDRRFRGQDRSHAMQLCYLNLAAFCGLRLGEINGLTLASIDLKGRIIKVRHNLTAWDELKGPKTRAGIRDVPMPEHVVELMREWMQLWYRRDERDLLFRTKNGTAISRAQMHNNFWRRLLKDAGIDANGEGFHHFHALRHFAASWMIQVGMTPPEVAHVLGHSHFDTTLQVYAHPVIGGNRGHEMADRMADSLRALPGARETPENCLIPSFPPVPD